MALLLLIGINYLLMLRKKIINCPWEVAGGALSVVETQLYTSTNAQCIAQTRYLMGVLHQQDNSLFFY